MLVINIVVCGYTEIVKKSYELQKNQLCMQEQLAKQELYYQDIIARQDESRALWHDIKKIHAGNGKSGFYENTT